MIQITAEQSKQLKQIQLDALKCFVKVCEQLSLRYYVIGGTLIGALRHKGFIPWDDDIDVAMMREDYEVFIKKAQELLPKKYFVQTIYSEKNTPFNFCKIRNSETTWVETSVKNFKINHGVCFDVFPLDFYPDNSKARRRFERKNILLKTKIKTKFSYKNKGLLKQIAIFALRLLLAPFSYRKAIMRREQLNKSVKESSLVANLCGAWGKKEIIDKSVFSDVVQLEFEGIMVNEPIGYDKWLTKVYGNYMELPPEEKRKAHHYVEMVDLENSYKKTYLKE